MPEQEDILYSTGDVRVVLRDHADEEIVALLDQTIWGTKETLYEHLHTAERIKHIKNPIFALLQKFKKTVSMVTLIERRTRIVSEPIKSVFLRYLTSVPEVRGTGFVGKGAHRTMNAIRDREKEPTIYYASVEAKNKRSLGLVSFVGYSINTVVKTVGFSRFFPKKSKRVRRVEKKEFNAIKNLIEREYDQYSLLAFDSIFLNNDYFVIEENGELIAGAQCHEAFWVIKHLPGWTGRLVVNIVPYIPLLNRIANPRNFRFMALEGIFCKEGRTEVLPELFSHILKEFDLYSALIWFDEKSSFYKKIQKLRLGTLHKIVSDSDSYLMASFKNMTPEQIESFDQNPKYIAAYDYI